MPEHILMHNIYILCSIIYILWYLHSMFAAVECVYIVRNHSIQYMYVFHDLTVGLYILWLYYRMYTFHDYLHSIQHMYLLCGKHVDERVGLRKGMGSENGERFKDLNGMAFDSHCQSCLKVSDRPLIQCSFYLPTNHGLTEKLCVSEGSSCLHIHIMDADTICESVKVKFIILSSSQFTSPPPPPRPLLFPL